MTATEGHYRSAMGRFGVDSDDRDIPSFLHDVADSAADALDDVGDWGLSGMRSGQYAADLVADDAVVPMLIDAGFAVLSEESGLSDDEPFATGGLLVIVDPLDGSTNAARGIPWFATALCVCDADGARVSLVAEQSGSEVRFGAIRGGGANCDGSPLHARPCDDPATAVLGFNGTPAGERHWWQSRVLGAAALDLCLVARGALDGYGDLHGHGVWDYAASLLVCRESGCLVTEADGRDLMPLDIDERRRPLVATSREILDVLTKVTR